jgi:hypothetical protein
MNWQKNALTHGSRGGLDKLEMRKLSCHEWGSKHNPSLIQAAAQSYFGKDSLLCFEMIYNDHETICLCGHCFGGTDCLHSQISCNLLATLSAPKTGSVSFKCCAHLEVYVVYLMYSD